MRTLALALAALLLAAAPTLAADPGCPGTYPRAVLAAERTSLLEIDAAGPVLGDAFADGRIREAVAGLVRDFKAAAEDLSGRGPGFRNELFLRAEPVCGPAGAVGVLLEGSSYTGGAHPAPILETLTFVPGENRQLGLADILTDPVAALTSVLPEIRAQVAARLDWAWDKDWAEGGMAPTLENYRCFLLTPKDLVVFFPHYQVAPYAAGRQEARIPLARLAPWLREGFAPR